MSSNRYLNLASSSGSGVKQSRNDDSALVSLFSNRLKVPFSKTDMPLNAWLWSAEALSFEFLESTTNDYIQWILPSPEPSSEFNTTPVILSPTAAASILANRSSLDNVFYAAVLMLGFWGLRVHFEDPEKHFISIVPTAKAAAYKNIARHSHDSGRMMRLVQCLQAIGLHHMSNIVLLAVNALLIGIATSEKKLTHFMTNFGFANESLYKAYNRSDDRPSSQKSADYKFEAAYLAEVASPIHPASEYVKLVQSIWDWV